MFEVEIDTFAPEHQRVRRADLSQAGVVEAVQAAAVAPAACIVVSNPEAPAVGEFMFWLAADRARVRLDLHREWYATDHAPAADHGSAPVPFRDDDGSTFLEDPVNTVTRDAALKAFEHWFRTGGMDPGLQWA